MNKHVPALSTALSIFAFTPASPAVHCAQEANTTQNQQ